MPSPIVKKMDSMSKRMTELLPSAKGGFLTNKWILYLVLFFAVFDVFHFYQKGDLQSVMIFFVVGILISFFSKNMVVILILAVVITHLIRYGKNLTEGFEEEDKEEFEDKEETEEGFEDEDREEFADETEETEKPNEESFRGTIKETDRSVKQALGDLDSNELTTKTKELLTTQQQIMENMKSLEPLLKNADTVLSAPPKKEKFTSLADAYPNR